MVTRSLLLLVGVAALSAACQRSAECRPGTVLLSFTVPTDVSVPTTADVVVTVGVTEKRSTVTVPGRDASVEVRFPNGYPVGETARFEIVFGNDSLSKTVALTAGCLAVSLGTATSIDGSADDLADDLASPDLLELDFNSCVVRSCEEQGLGCGETMNGCGVPLSCGACMIAATAPIVAETDQSLVLEGRFGKVATVSFPGGASVAAEVLGPNRIRVAVPASATAGLLSVVTDGSTTNSVRFARASYKLGLAGPVQRESFQTLYAASASNLDVARDRAATVTTGPYVFAVGGQGDSGVQATVSKARRNADGSLLGFVQNTSSLMAARRSHAAVHVGTRIYVLGGAGSSGALASVESATIQADGTLGPFVVEQSTLSQARESFAYAVIGKYLYVFGGFGSGGGALDTVERAVIQGDGSLGSFSAFTVTLKTPRAGGAALVIGDKLYLIGGASITGSEIATINAVGDVGEFATSDLSGALAAARQLFGVARIGSQVVVAGGADGARLASIETATIADGALGNFATAPQSLLQVRSGLALVNTGSELQVIGGISGASPEFRVERVSINASGSIGGFSAFTASQLNVQRAKSTCAVVGDKLYVIGGSRVGAENDIEVSTIVEDGKLGPFTSLGQLNHIRFGAALVRDGYTLGVVGGNNDVPEWVVTPETASISEDGETLSAFSDGATASPTWRMRPIVTGDRMHIVGTVSPDDKLVTWNSQFSGAYSEKTFSLVTPRNAGALMVLADREYVIGGSYKPSGNPTVYPTSIERSVMGTGSTATSIMSFEAAGDLPAGRRDAMLAVIGASVYLLGGQTTSANTDVLRATIDAQGALGTFAPAPAITTTARAAGGCAIRVGNYLYLLGSVPNTSAWIEVAPLN